MKYEESDVILTKHSIQRTKDRIGISKKLTGKNAQKAMEYGLTHAQTKGGLKRYIDKLYLTYRTGNNIRVYHRYIYIFKDNTLITIIDLPRKFHALADKLQERGVNGESQEC